MVSSGASSSSALSRSSLPFAKRFSGEGGSTRSLNEPVFEKFESYRRESQLPTKVEELRVCINTIEDN